MKSPFKFLDSYTKDDREIFFGRDREIEELYHRVFESKIMLVYGVSGTGKSSLIHCGLANKFQDTDWLPIVIRRGGNIIESMAAGIRSASITEQQNKLVTPADFKKGVRSLYLDHYKPVFFIFDQFEELFIFGDKEERKSFINIVKSLFESELQCRLIFVMREEYMAGVTEFEKYISTFFSNRVRIEKMSHANALEAIKEPCKVFNINLEEGFAETLLEKLSPGETDVELTFLQVFLDRLFRLAQTEKHSGTEGINFNLSLFQKTGDVSDLLGSFLEEQLKELDEPDTGLTILKSFVSLKGTKKQLTEEEVIDASRAYGKDIPSSVVSDLLQKFVNIRVLRDKNDSGQYELRHDSLASKIYEKITIVEKEMMEIYQFLENALNSYQKRKVLLSANDLKYLSPYEDRLFVNKETEELIEISRKELNKGKRRLKRAAIAGFVAILIISGGMILALYGINISWAVKKLGQIIFVVWFLPMFIYYTFRTRENRTVNILFLIFTLFFLGYSYLINKNYSVRIRESFGRPLNQTNKKILETIGRYDLIIDSTYKKIYSGSDQNKEIYNKYKKIAGDLRGKAYELDNYINNLKVEITNETEGPESQAIKNNKIDIYEIKKLDEGSVSVAVMIGQNRDGKAFTLRSILRDYKNYLANISDSNKIIIGVLDNTINLNDRKTIVDGKEVDTESWEYYNFIAKGLGFTLITLSQFQADVKYCESEVMTYLYNKMLSEIEQGHSNK